MDYNLAALKLLCVQLRSATATPSPNAFTLGSILFQRAWLQGILVSVPSSSDGAGSRRFTLDDGTGVIDLHVANNFGSRQWEAGMYVMVVGAYIARADNPPTIKVHKMVDLSLFPDRESMWYLEVIEAFKMFYQPLFEDDVGEKV